MGVNIDKNEYYEIVKSNSAFPERGIQSKICTPVELPVPKLLTRQPLPKGLEYPVVDVLPNVDGNCVVVKLELLEKKGSSSKDELNDGVKPVS